MQKKIIGTLTAFLLGLGLALAAPVSAAPAAPAAGAPVGWEYVSAEQNALDQQKDASTRTMVWNRKMMIPPTSYGCPGNYICLYAWVNFGGGRWQVKPNNWNGNGTCWNLSGSSYTDGGNVNNTSASMIVNRAANPTYPILMTLSDWVCGPSQSSGDQVGMDANDTVFKTNISTGWTSGINWYHRFTAMQLDFVCATPSQCS